MWRSLFSRSFKNKWIQIIQFDLPIDLFYKLTIQNLFFIQQQLNQSNQINYEFDSINQQINKDLLSVSYINFSKERKQMIKEKKQVKLSTSTKHSFVVMATSDCLKLDKNKINFCKYPIFGSSSKQITLLTELMDYFIDYQRKDFHLLKLKTITHPVTGFQQAKNPHVFTVKAVQTGQQSTELEVPIKAGENIQLFVKATIPQLKISTDISGQLLLQIDEFTPMLLQINARGEVPQIICMKEMENLSTKEKIIKIPSKNIMKIPFKNSSNINFFFQIKLLGKDGQKTQADGVKLKIVPNQPPIKFEQDKTKKQSIILKVDANSAFCITLEFELIKKEPIIRVARRLLILQVQGTKLNFPFPLQVIISE